MSFEEVLLVGDFESDEMIDVIFVAGEMEPSFVSSVSTLDELLSDGKILTDQQVVVPSYLQHDRFLLPLLYKKNLLVVDKGAVPLCTAPTQAQTLTTDSRQWSTRLGVLLGI